MSKFNKDSVGGTLTVVVLLSLVCSLIVAGAAVLLKPAQEIQKQLDKQKNILQAAGLLQKNTNVQETYAKFIEPKIVDLATGDYVDGMKNFDAKASAKNPATSIAIAAEDDKAGIKVRSKFAEVYLVRDEAGKVTQVVLPMYGNGLWSIMYGLVAVQTDANTINGITYYEQGETAGLGGEIANPNWQKYFVGKKLFNDTNEVALRVGKNASSDKEHGVDALSGATLTSNGVDGSFKYWFGPNGFGPYLAKFKAEGAN
ncbi:Na(+)-translocating NADH-quinone reductase subunit C [Bisgaard Taxon 10/6]|uniref:Na(+)-translocating NADH-quinone reductase subunit C n=1 Tax=Exercitatus varius TaxID=67857 RepID=A0AAW6Q8S9_9PAST|nr:Na(+)-translocating NADH-quinone reductase subunit C [Exercitatus varius]MDG2915533.1 Na(+)-translocating NADH-quinone reductase subunit C [Exercitatus varius]MDG2917482.1 Na(+)-translocating NADH-quinone reductase subunit C [Exercitatus varius]MDG2949758.1 Na(+)-translocating NADH-quinone reductase subunit C [Exercitatus varius]MDG2952364.1 Na(+)-translocating NADH-quinone reductase subunit C [Exercitatus varius]MDG2953978.1 Na(+)-translocating NADH-quinone reductase subunit C [Exercitatus